MHLVWLFGGTCYLVFHVSFLCFTGEKGKGTNLSWQTGNRFWDFCFTGKEKRCACIYIDY